MSEAQIRKTILIGLALLALISAGILWQVFHPDAWEKPPEAIPHASAKPETKSLTRSNLVGINTLVATYDGILASKDADIKNGQDSMKQLASYLVQLVRMQGSDRVTLSDVPLDGDMLVSFTKTAPGKIELRVRTYKHGEPLKLIPNTLDPTPSTTK